MARPLSTPDPYRVGNGNGTHAPRIGLDDAPAPRAVPDEAETIRLENDQLRALCAELEQALQEATANALDPAAVEERLREYELMLDEKTETIRQLHQQLDEARSATAEAEAEAKPAPARQGPVPREEELLHLSEELEGERRQLQEDKQAVEEDMRRMELAMARERAEMARQRNDLQRLNGEIRHELERLERNGALQSKMDELKAKLQDATTRRGAALHPAGGRPAASSPALPNVQPGQAPQPTNGTSKPGFMGRFFGK